MTRQTFGAGPTPAPTAVPAFEATVDALDVATMLASHWPGDVLAELLAGAGALAVLRQVDKRSPGPWADLITVLEQAVRLSSTPAMASCDVPTSWYVSPDATEPLSVFVIPPDGAPEYQSTVVPAGYSFRVPALAGDEARMVQLWARPASTTCGCLDDPPAT
jgi:hypothetical protein